MTTAKTVLVVEDYAELRELFEEILDAAGYLTLTAPDGMAALAAVSGHANPAIAGGAPLPPDAKLLQKPFMESELLEKLNEVMAEPAQVLP